MTDSVNIPERHAGLHVFTSDPKKRELIEEIGAAEAALAEAQRTWRCFFCDFSTTDPREAAAHFGDRDDDEEFKPICKWWQRMSAVEKVSALQDTIQQLNDEQEESSQLQQQLAEAQAETKNADDDVASLEAELSVAWQQVAEAQKERDASRQISDGWYNKNQELKQRVARQAETISTLKREKDALKKALDSFQPRNFPMDCELCGQKTTCNGDGYLAKAHTGEKPWKVGSILIYRDQRFGYHRYYEVVGIYLGGINEESIIEIKNIGEKPGSDGDMLRATMFVPECLTRNLETAESMESLLARAKTHTGEPKDAS